MPLNQETKPTFLKIITGVLMYELYCMCVYIYIYLFIILLPQGFLHIHLKEFNG